MAEDIQEFPNGEDQEVRADPPGATKTDTQSLEQQLEEQKSKADEYLNNWRRTAAEFSNYKKRVDREKADYTQFANAALLAKLLDVMDGFDAAFNAIPEKFRSEPWVEGIKLVQQKLARVLESEGLKPIQAEGQDFDPNYHEAMFYEPSPGQPEGRVIGEFQRGYTLGDRVLRPSRVKVAQGTPAGEGQKQASGRGQNKASDGDEQA